MFRRSVILKLALASLACAFAFAVPAQARGAKHAAMILDANTGAVLHSDNADELRYPASLTKMMTLYLAFETLKSGRMSMSDRVKISQEAASQAPSKLDLEPGESLSVSEAIRALVTKSANDVAVALAEKVGGSQKNFVRLMNARARDLGMTKTHFENASGLPNDDQVTTARDMVTLGLHLQDDFPEYYPLFATGSFSFGRKTYRNHNTMLRTFQGIDGIKTGYTRASGFNLVSSVRRGERHVVGAVFGGSSAAARNGEMRNLLTRALARASTKKTRKPDAQLIAKLTSPPKIAERPKPKDKSQLASAPNPAPQPKPFAPARAETAPEPVQMAEAARPAPAAAPQLDAEAPAAAPIDVFKVKRVMVAPRQGPNPPPQSADDTTDMSASETGDDDSRDSEADTAADAAPSAPAATGTIAATLAALDGAVRETVIPKTTVVAPMPTATASLASPLGDRIAMLGAREVVQPQAVDDPAPRIVAASMTTARPEPRPETKRAAQPQRALADPVPPRPVPAKRGRAPSSLQAQAAMLPTASPQRYAALQPPANEAPAAAPSGRYEIQIGAYTSIEDAQQALTSAQTRTGTLLNGYGSVTHPVEKSGRLVYRARFSGFDAKQASGTCTQLRRQSIDCFVMTAE